MCYSLATFLCFLALLTLWVKLTTANISLGSSLTAGDGLKRPWLSPSGDFAFGFQQAPDPSEGFLVAIWYNKIPQKTITWSANRDNLAPNGSKLNLTANGLVLSDSDGKIMWNTSGSGVAYASILDTGNFVVSDKTDATIWQSFDYPTDTILPTQVMSMGTQLIARLSDTNYASGRFSAMMQTDGIFVCYILSWPQPFVRYTAYTYYFATPWSYSIGFELVYDKSGQIYIVGKKGNVLGNVFQADIFFTYHRRAILEFDGVFREYGYPISNSTNQSMNWMVLDYVPRDICNQTGTEGGGPCGFNSYCQMGADVKPDCSCPPGYSLSNESDYMQGCNRAFIPQSCLGEQEHDQFEIQRVDYSSFGGTSYETFTKSETDCRENCLSDCRCDAVVFDGEKCFKKGYPLSNGRLGIGDAETTFFKIRVGSYKTNRVKWDQVEMCWP